VVHRLKRQPLLARSAEELGRSAVALSEPQVVVAKEARDDR
jgi:hypothetical protein